MVWQRRAHRGPRPWRQRYISYTAECQVADGSTAGATMHDGGDQLGERDLVHWRAGVELVKVAIGSRSASCWSRSGMTSPPDL